MNCRLFNRTCLIIIAALACLAGCSKKNSDDTNNTGGAAITGFSVDSAWVGRIITINGRGFSETTAGNTVRIGNTVVTDILEASATALKIRVPAGAATAKVFVVTIDAVSLTSPNELKIVNQLALQRLLGGTAYEEPGTIVPLADGGYLVAASTISSNGDITGFKGIRDFWVVKLKADLSIAWQKTLGGTNADRATSIVPTTDGGCVVAGETWSTNGDATGNHGSTDFLVIKLNANGDIIWRKVFGGSSADVPYSIIAVPSGYVVAGSTDSNDGNVTGNHGEDDYWVVWLDANGSLIRQKTYGGTGADKAYTMTAGANGSILLTGYSYSNNGDVSLPHGKADCWVLKLNATGNIIWQKAIGGTEDEEGRSIISNADGSIMVAAPSNSSNGDITGAHGDSDFWIVKLDANGLILWQKALGGTRTDIPRSIIATTDGGYAVTGITSSSNGDVTNYHGGDYDNWMVRLNGGGAILWQKSLGGSQTDYGQSLATAGNGFILAGSSASTDGDVATGHGNADVWVFKLHDL